MTDGHMTDFERFGRITASVVPAILRSSRQSRKWAWRVITGREPLTIPGLDIQRGLDHEEDAIAALEAQTGLLARPGRFVPHPHLEWLGASPDGFIADIPIEAKCPREAHTKVPQMYYDQMQTQMECCDQPYAFFVSWTENSHWIKQVYRDNDWWERNRPVLENFYTNYVLADVEPPRSARRNKTEE